MAKKLDKKVEEIFEEISETVEKDNSVQVVEEKDVKGDAPTMDSPEWTEYVIRQLDDAELENGNPTVAGLRRVIGELMGEIVSSETHIVTAPNERYKSCTAIHTLEISSPSIYNADRVLKFNGAVDVSLENTPAPYNLHLVSTADTRAEAKALRRALKLRGVTSEELVSNPLTKNELEMSQASLINDQQIMSVNVMAERNNINVKKFIVRHASWADLEYINDLSNQDGAILLSNLSEMQRKPKNIDESFVGYDENWKEYFYKKG